MLRIKELGVNVLEDKFYLSHSQLVEEAIKKDEVKIGPRGSLLVRTGKYTGRCPKDRFIVDSKNLGAEIAWGKINQKISKENFDLLLEKAVNYAESKEMYTTDCFCGADNEYKIKVRFITEYAWHSVFVRNMFLRSKKDEFEKKGVNFTVLNVSNLVVKDYQKYSLNSEIFIIIDLERKIAIISGTRYSGEMKKCIFSIMNYYLPQKGVFPMHCSANEGQDGDVALFFGLSGTGKTTLSSDVQRKLIGDDEHGWSDNGVFNFEGGCYAKCINLSKEKEPIIWDAIQYGAILENVIYNLKTHKLDYTDSNLTENTRVSYPIYLVKNRVKSGYANHPKNIIFLTADAFGVLPPVAKLTPEQASYHFLSGYTSKIAGTESGITEPQATFSACFGEPFMMLSPQVYTKLLVEKINKYNCNVFLINTGWFGGNYEVGKRIELKITRQIIDSILDGSILDAEYRLDDYFCFNIPKSLKGVPENILCYESSWKNQNDYIAIKKKLVLMFNENFKRFGDSFSDIAAHGPIIK